VWPIKRLLKSNTVPIEKGTETATTVKEIRNLGRKATPSPSRRGLKLNNVLRYNSGAGESNTVPIEKGTETWKLTSTESQPPQQSNTVPIEKGTETPQHWATPKKIFVN